PLARSCAPKGEGRRALARRGGVRGRSILIAIEFHPHPIARAFGLGGRPPPLRRARARRGAAWRRHLSRGPSTRPRVRVSGPPPRLRRLPSPRHAPAPPFIATRCSTK